MVFRFRRTFKPDGPDRFVVNLGPDERAVVRAVCEDLTSVLEDGAANPMLRRLFPSAHATDPEVDRHYRDQRILGIGGGATEILNDLTAKLLGFK